MNPHSKELPAQPDRLQQATGRLINLLDAFDTETVAQMYITKDQTAAAKREWQKAAQEYPEYAQRISALYSLKDAARSHRRTALRNESVAFANLTTELQNWGISQPEQAVLSNLFLIQINQPETLPSTDAHAEMSSIAHAIALPQFAETGDLVRILLDSLDARTILPPASTDLS